MVDVWGSISTSSSKEYRRCGVEFVWVQWTDGWRDVFVHVGTYFNKVFVLYPLTGTKHIASIQGGGGEEEDQKKKKNRLKTEQPKSKSLNFEKVGNSKYHVTQCSLNKQPIT